MRISFAAASILLMFLCASSTSAQEWATLRGRIVYDGTPPIPERIKVDKDVEVCGKFDLFDESLVVHQDNHGVKDVVIQLSLGRRDTIDVHESYKADEAGQVLLENECCRFDPHVTVMRTTQKLVIHNADPKGDSVKIDPINNNAINVTLPTGSTHVQEFPLAERIPARVSCSIHPWELGWLIIADHPYVAVTDKDGRFEIKDLPVGERSFMFWQEKAGYLAEVTYQGTKETWRRGIRELDLKPGVNDLGEIVVEPELFKQ